MKAMETTYRGYRFRSRLEARWAVFFDAMKLKWEYEPEGFDLGNGVYYLPDFRITSPQGLTSWYEIKPSGTERDEKFTKFAIAMNFDNDYSHCSLLSGDPAEYFAEANSRGGGMCPRCGSITQIFYSWYEDDHEVGVGCHLCDVNTPSGGGHPVESGMYFDCTPHKGMIIADRKDWRWLVNIKIPEACAKARAARFEHDERALMARL